MDQVEKRQYSCSYEYMYIYCACTMYIVFAILHFINFVYISKNFLVRSTYKRRYRKSTEMQDSFFYGFKSSISYIMQYYKKDKMRARTQNAVNDYLRTKNYI